MLPPWMLCRSCAAKIASIMPCGTMDGQCITAIGTTAQRMTKISVPTEKGGRKRMETKFERAVRELEAAQESLDFIKEAFESERAKCRALEKNSRQADRRKLLSPLAFGFPEAYVLLTHHTTKRSRGKPPLLLFFRQFTALHAASNEFFQLRDSAYV